MTSSFDPFEKKKNSCQSKSAWSGVSYRATVQRRPASKEDFHIVFFTLFRTLYTVVKPLAAGPNRYTNLTLKRLET